MLILPNDIMLDIFEFSTSTILGDFEVDLKAFFNVLTDLWVVWAFDKNELSLF